MPGDPGPGFIPSPPRTNMHRAWLRHFTVTALFLLLSTHVIHSQQGAGKLEAGHPAGSLIKPNILTTAFPLINKSGLDADQVEIKTISVDGGSLTSPTNLPLQLGTIPVDHSATVFATFTSRSFV